MNTKRVFALVLVLAMVLVLTPVRAAKAEECPKCGDPLVAIYSDVYGHVWACSSLCGYEKYEDHTLDENCWCSVCKNDCHNLDLIGQNVHTQPTCTEPRLDYDGFLYICLRCGQYMADRETPVNPVTAPALGHDLKSVPAKAPTCMEVGWEAYAGCSRCEYKEHYFEIPVDPNNHDWDTEWSFDENGHYHKCLNDGCTAKSDEAAHSGGTATCVKGPICEKCGSEYGDPDTENGHSWDTEWTWDDREHWHPCNNEGCEAKQGAAAHEPEIVPGKPATCTEEGTTDALFCSVCGAPISEQEIIGKIKRKVNSL